MKEYSYDPVGELRQSRHSLQGTTGHRYDATGRIEESVRSAANSERFAYDPAGNLLDASTAPGYVRDNLVRVFEDKRYSYDGHGRLVRKLSGRHTDQRFEWDDESRLVAVHTTRRPGTPEATTQVTRFDYDAMGRRVAKHDAFGSTRFVWEGMRLIEERRGSQVTSHVYEPGSYMPLARLDAAAGEAGAAAPANIFHLHTDQAGLPEELTDQAGRICWRASYRTWGGAVTEQWESTLLDGRAASPANKALPRIEQNMRFQGQYLDRDIGLHYNTFRFYDPDIGRFISPDPIGLAGGNNLQSYAPNPVSWIDPWGWAPKAPLSLPDGYRARIDRFNTSTGSSFEIHVYKPNGTEAGIYGPDGFFNKHGTVGAEVKVTPKVSNVLNGIAVDELRKIGKLPALGTPNSRVAAREYSERVRKSGLSGC